MFDVREPTQTQIDSMHEAGVRYREAIAEMIANPTQKTRDGTQAMGMAFHHHVRMHAPYILERLTEIIGEPTLKEPTA